MFLGHSATGSLRGVVAGVSSGTDQVLRVPLYGEACGHLFFLVMTQHKGDMKFRFEAADWPCVPKQATTGVRQKNTFQPVRMAN